MRPTENSGLWGSAAGDVSGSQTYTIAPPIELYSKRRTSSKSPDTLMGTRLMTAVVQSTVRSAA